jgi:1-aminocyclopropane-1-carboxylate deaminase
MSLPPKSKVMYKKMSIPFQLPETFAQIPRHAILYPTPSPIHPLPSIANPRLSPHHPLITLHAKREDHSSPLACAGNKYRKLEYIVPDILSQTPLHHAHENSPFPQPQPLRSPATTLVTEGALQSNHTVQVAALARKLGLNAVILLHRGTGGGLAAATDATAFQNCGNVQINRLLGAEVRVCEEGHPLAWDATPLLDELREAGEIPYWIPGGASLHPLGGLGYARAAFEIAAQEREMGLAGSGRFDYVFVACGSGSTVGGLVAGFKLLEKIGGSTTAMAGRGHRKVIGILNSPTRPRAYHEARVLAFARRAGKLIGLDAEREIGLEDVRLDDRFVGSAYGVLDEESREALVNMAEMEGMVLDPVYTAKVARGMMHWVNEGEVVDSARSSDVVNVLFIHTGGQAALGAYADVI